MNLEIIGKIVLPEINLYKLLHTLYSNTMMYLLNSTACEIHTEVKKERLGDVDR